MKWQMYPLRSVTADGQLRIPVDLLRQLNIRPGDKVVVEEIEGRLILTPPRKRQEARRE